MNFSTSEWGARGGGGTIKNAGKRSVSCERGHSKHEKTIRAIGSCVSYGVTIERSGSRLQFGREMQPVRVGLPAPACEAARMCAFSIDHHRIAGRFDN